MSTIEELIAANRADSRWMKHWETIELLAGALIDNPPESMPTDEPVPAIAKTREQVEAFCSNNAEGSQLTVDQATTILQGTDLDLQIDRLQLDQEDLKRYIKIIEDPALRSTSPLEYAEWQSLLLDRHRILFGHRRRFGVRPGEFKNVDNRTDDYVYVKQSQVIDMLACGFYIGQDIPRGLSRAVFLHYLVVEVHPFMDGNGRSARLVANAELIANGEQPCITTFKHRNEMIAANKELRNKGNATTMIDQWQTQQRWTCELNFTEVGAAN